MRKIAIVPWDDSIKKDNIYQNSNWHGQFKKAFEEHGYEFHTIDMYSNLGEVDWFLFFTLNYKWLSCVIRHGKLGRLIYCSGEPEVVEPENSADGYKELLKLFAFILTWNDDLVDNKRIFKRCIPYDFKKQYGTVPFEERKLLVNVSGNKHSTHPEELYSERERVITYFEQHAPEEFDLYGTGWNKETHPSYLGVVDDKIEAYHHYRFALCLENTANVKGYLTEKLFDCFVAGIVPIYYGAADIDEYVPQNCYIPYHKFKDIEEMRIFLEKITEEEYRAYLVAIDRLLNTDIQSRFTGTLFAKQVLLGIEQASIPESISISGMVKNEIAIKAYKESMSKFFLNTKLNCKKIVNLLRERKNAKR